MADTNTNTSADGNFLNTVLSFINPAAGATSTVLGGILKPQTPTAVAPIQITQKNDDTLLYVVLGASVLILLAVGLLAYKLG